VAKVLPVVQYEYTALYDYDLRCNDKQLRVFRRLWKKGFDVGFIAREIGKHPIEVMCLIMDQAEKGYIDPREGGIMGNRGQK
jgi:hypothetical protein